MKKFIFILLSFSISLPANTQVPYKGGDGDGFSAVTASSINLSLADSLYNGVNGNGFSQDTSLNVSLFLIDGLYNGGNGNGFTKDTALSVSLSVADSLYNGGNGNGFSKDTALNVSLSVADSLYNGGIGNGFSKDTVLNVSLGILDSLYNGGIGNGFHSVVITNTSLYLLDSLYNGGPGRGELQTTGLANLGSCSDILIWTGNTSVNWDNAGNWDCGTIPGVNSTVIIPSGKVRYPVIFFNTVIRKLELKDGAVIILFTGKNLILNGQ